MKMNVFKIGDYVVSNNHGHKGRIYGFEDRESITADWFDCQSIQPTDDQKNGVWVKIMVHLGGAVVVPFDTMTRLPKFKFEHRDAVEQFGEEA